MSRSITAADLLACKERILSNEADSSPVASHYRRALDAIQRGDTRLAQKLLRGAPAPLSPSHRRIFAHAKRRLA